MTDNNSDKELLSEFQGFSERLIKLAKEIEAKFTEKQRLEEIIKEREQKIKEKQIEIRKLDNEIFQDRQRLVKLDLELQKLMVKMKGFEEKKSEA